MSSITSQDSRYLTPQEAAEFVRASRKTVYRWIADGSLPAIRLGNGPRAHVRISVDDLETYIERHKTAAF